MRPSSLSTTTASLSLFLVQTEADHAALAIEDDHRSCAHLGLEAEAPPTAPVFHLRLGGDPLRSIGQGLLRWDQLGSPLPIR